MDPQQELFTKIKMELEKTYDVYDSILPPDDTPYPFIYLGDNQLDDIFYKGIIGGRVYQTIHVWHNNSRQRGLVSSILLFIKQTLRMIDKTTNFNWTLRSINQQILPDNSTAEPLMHGVLEVEYRFN